MGRGGSRGQGVKGEGLFKGIREGVKSLRT